MKTLLNRLSVSIGRFAHRLVLIFLIAPVSMLSGCFKDFADDYRFTDFVLEIDLATWESAAPGKTYPIMGPYDKGSGVYTYQVNVIGERKSTDQTVRYRVVPEETTAIEGTHFRLHDGGSFVIDADSGTGEVSIEILDFPAEAGVDTLVFELLAGDGVQVSENYKKLGLAISLTGPPSPSHTLHTQLGPSNYFNSIFLDPLNPSLPADIVSRFNQSATNLRNRSGGAWSLQNMYFYFADNDRMIAIARYYTGNLANLSIAAWTYKLNLDADGVGHFELESASSNGTTFQSDFAPLLADYLENYEFRVDWVDASIATPPSDGKQLGGFFRTDAPNSYLFGTLEALSPTGSIVPFPQSPAVHDLFNDGQGGYFSSILINPDDLAQSPEFRAIWQDGKTYIAGLAGRQLHRMLLYYNPVFNFQDVRLVNYYYTGTGGASAGQIRFQFNLGFDGEITFTPFIFQDANGNATRSPQIVDNFLMVTEFRMTRNGDRIRFTSIVDPNVFFEGVLGNHLSIPGFWPE